MGRKPRSGSTERKKRKRRGDDSTTSASPASSSPGRCLNISSSCKCSFYSVGNSSPTLVGTGITSHKEKPKAVKKPRGKGAGHSATKGKPRPSKRSLSYSGAENLRLTNKKGKSAMHFSHFGGLIAKYLAQVQKSSARGS